MSSSTTSGGGSLRGRVVRRRERLRLARHAQHRRAQVDAAARTAASWRRRRTGSTGSGSSLGERLGELELGRRHGLEVGALQALAVGEGQRGVEVDLVAPSASVGGVRRRGGRGGASASARRFGARRVAPAVDAAADLAAAAARIMLLGQLRVAPEGVEGGVEQRLLLVAVEHHRARARHARRRAGRAPTCSTAASAASTRSGPIGMPAAAQHAARSGRCCRRAWRSRGGGRSAGRWRRSGRTVAGRPPRPAVEHARARSSSSSFAASPPCSRTMSSRYLSSTPSVSCTVAGSSRMASSATSALVQSIVSATPGALKRSSAAHALHELDDLRRQPLGRAPGAFSRTISSSRSASGKSTQ